MNVQNMLIHHDFFTHTVHVLLMHTLLVLSAVHSQFGTLDPAHTYRLYIRTLVHGLQILTYFLFWPALSVYVCVDPLHCVQVLHPPTSNCPAIWPSFS